MIYNSFIAGRHGAAVLEQTAPNPRNRRHTQKSRPCGAGLSRRSSAKSEARRTRINPQPGPAASNHIERAAGKTRNINNHQHDKLTEETLTMNQRITSPRDRSRVPLPAERRRIEDERCSILHPTGGNGANGEKCKIFPLRSVTSVCSCSLAPSPILPSPISCLFVSKKPMNSQKSNLIQPNPGKFAAHASRNPQPNNPHRNSTRA